MSKAAKLGSGSSFSQTQRVSPRRQAINDATKAPTEGTPPPVQLPVELISLNPANPRSELGDLTQLAGSMRDHGQKQAISIMSRFTYVEANPGQEASLEPDTRYVVIDGNSRLAAAREAGLATVKVMLDEELGSNPDEILESALVANVHRQDLDPLDEARALEQLKTVYGTQEALAARLHRTQGWVSQRLALLKLTPELQQKLQSGEESAELLRSVGSKKPGEQEEHLQRLKEKKRQEEEDRKTRAAERERATARSTTQSPASAPARAPQSQAAVGGGAHAQDADDDHYGVMKAPPLQESGPTVPVPDPRPAGVNKPPQAKMPWADGVASMDIIFSKVPTPERQRMIGRYLELLGKPEVFVAELKGACTPEYRKRVAELLLKDL
ncbi:ParB/RepB/Spo0J family partition protein [Streptomyces sp. NPDC048248]|uniref:ParB/RepB/Spo0J family partition protein n=1 Tax=Streptomyces sp. NPDC048248 TaxID=3365523 RepID=UPI00371FBD2A